MLGFVRLRHRANQYLQRLRTSLKTNLQEQEERFANLNAEPSQRNTCLQTPISARQAANDQFQQLLDALPDAMLVFEPSGRIVLANARAESLFGYSCAELLALTTERLIPERFRNHHREQFQPVFANPSGPARLLPDRRIQTRSGNEIPVDISLGFHESNPCSLAIATFRQADWRLEREQMLYRSEARARQAEQTFRHLIENASDGIIICDLEGRILEVNTTLCQQLEYRREELLGQTPALFEDPESASHIPERLQTLEESGSVRFDTVLWSRKGRRLPVEVNTRTIDFNGQAAAIAIHRDISERKALEAELRWTREAAEVLNRAKSGFIATISHEIRTPMNAIVGINYLLAQTSLNPQQKDYVDKIRISARGLLDLLNNILDFSKIEAGKFELERIPFRFDSVLLRIGALFGASAERKNIALRISVDPDVPPVLVGDPLRLHQVLANLVGNAIKFTERGEVVARTRVERIDDQAIVLRFTVRDTGIGIEPQQIQHLFEGFRQTQKSSARRFGGTGLGLAISQRLVRLMNGTLQADSTPGQGSTFSFTARFGHPQDALLGSTDILPESPPSLPILAGARILLVDGDATNRQVTAETLDHSGAEVATAGAGQRALALLNTETSDFDAVVLALNLPDMDACDIVRMLRSRIDHAGLPVIAITTDTNPENHERCLAAGINQLIVKPFEPFTLLRSLWRWIHQETVKLEMPGPDPGRGGRPESALAELVRGLKQPESRPDSVQPGKPDCGVVISELNALASLLRSNDLAAVDAIKGLKATIGGFRSFEVLAQAISQLNYPWALQVLESLKQEMGIDDATNASPETEPPADR